MSAPRFPWPSLLLLVLLSFIVGAGSVLFWAGRGLLPGQLLLRLAITGAAVLAVTLLVIRQRLDAWQTRLAEDVAHFAGRQAERTRTIGHP